MFLESGQKVKAKRLLILNTRKYCAPGAILTHLKSDGRVVVFENASGERFGIGKSVLERFVEVL